MNTEYRKRKNGSRNAEWKFKGISPRKTRKRHFQFKVMLLDTLSPFSTRIECLSCNQRRLSFKQTWVFSRHFLLDIPLKAIILRFDAIVFFSIVRRWNERLVWMIAKQLRFCVLLLGHSQKVSLANSHSLVFKLYQWNYHTSHYCAYNRIGCSFRVQ